MSKLKILFATGNQNKVKEVQKLVENDEIEILSLKDLKLDNLDVEENGKTFEDNAKIKAEFFSKHTDLPVIADDSGLVIDALNGEPGVYSARYLGETLSFKDKCKIILEKMKELKSIKDRSARFVCVACLAKNGKTILCKEGRVEGYISFELRGEKGFGYDPIFFYPQLNMTFAEMPLEEKNKISHRFKAFKSLFEEIKKLPELTREVSNS